VQWLKQNGPRLTGALFYHPDIINMKLRKPDIKDIIISVETFILFFLLFRYWDQVKMFIAALFA
jgi:hypothetical protein